jgi:hypothetical protein
MTNQETLNQLVVNKISTKLNQAMTTFAQVENRLREQDNMMVDFIAPIGVDRGENPIITFSGNGRVKMNIEEDHFSLHANAVTQLAAKLNIPGAYLSKLANSKDEQFTDLAAMILNRHSMKTTRSRALIRAVGDEVRGVLSDQYRRLDSIELVTAFIKCALSSGAKIIDAKMDDTRVKFDAIYPTPFILDTQLNGLVAIAFGLRLMTSDFGNGALSLQSYMLQGVCLNGLVAEKSLNTKHLGKRLPDDLSLSQQTYALDTATQVSAIGDFTRNLLSKPIIENRAKQILEVASTPVDVLQEVKRLTKINRITKGEAENLSNLLMNGSENDGVAGQNSKWKLINGLTALARDNEDMTRQRDLEELAGELLTGKKISESDEE